MEQGGSAIGLENMRIVDETAESARTGRVIHL